MSGQIAKNQICASCRMVFHNKRKRKYCSRKCNSKRSSLYNVNRWAKAVMSRLCRCVVCDKSYVNWNSNDGWKCCSRECGFEYQRIEAKQNPKPKRIVHTIRLQNRCDSCAVQIRNRLKYCSACSIDKSRAKGRQWSKANYKPRIRIINCRECNRLTAVNSITSTRCKDCQSIFNKKNKTLRDKQRAEHYGVEYEPINRLRVFERDNWKCQICGIKVVSDAPTTWEPNYATLDHIVPISKGGDHLYENVQTACWNCNCMIKRDSITPPP